MYCAIYINFWGVCIPIYRPSLRPCNYSISVFLLYHIFIEGDVTVESILCILVLTRQHDHVIAYKYLHVSASRVLLEWEGVGI